MFFQLKRPKYLFYILAHNSIIFFIKTTFFESIDFIYIYALINLYSVYKQY
jgi:hypothetical protein